MSTTRYAALFLFCWSICFVQASQAQSTAIQLPAAPVETSGLSAADANNRLVTNSISIQVLQWEQLLSHAQPTIREKVKVGDLLTILERSGVPIHLDQTAIDDCCVPDDVLDLRQNIGASFYQRLSTALAELNAVLIVVKEQLFIISVDFANDPEYFLTVIYDVSRLGAHPEFQIANTIMSTIDPDSWDDTNGDGALTYLNTNGRRLLVISQSYVVHIEIRRFFDELARIGVQPSNGIAYRYDDAQALSTPVEPVQNSESRTYRVIQRGTLEFGRRSAGGVF